MELKDYQVKVLERLDTYLSTLSSSKEEAEEYFEFQVSRGKEAKLDNYCAKAWDELNTQRKLPELRDRSNNRQVAPYINRYDGMDRGIPNVCYRVPTGGGKTLLAAASLERIQTDYFKEQTGFVLWVVPSDSIYKQTWKSLANREHPYRQMLERASGGRVKLLEKDDAFTKRDVEQQLCVMLLMLQSSNRKSKESLRMFRDSGRFTSFFPVEDDWVANDELLSKVRNLESNDLAGGGLFGNNLSIKMSLGNVLRLVRPTIIIDEGHKAYSDSARDTLCGMNPKFILELSATPNSKGKHHSNVLVNVPGQNLKEEQMIKIPINVSNDSKADWKHTLATAHAQLESISKEADDFHNESGRYIRPIMVIRVERTGKEQRDSGFVHTDDVRDYLVKNLGVDAGSIKEKTASADEIGDEDLMSEYSPVRYIITKDALREGWDCPFAYVLTVLSKMTAQAALTQMVGRVLRQPHAESTGRQLLDECYVFTYDQDVTEAVESVKKGLEEEGMGDLTDFVNGSNEGDSTSPNKVRVESIALRDSFKQDVKSVYLPRVLHRDHSEAEGYRLFDYEQDILGELDWDEFTFSKAESIVLQDETMHRTVARVEFEKAPDLLSFDTYEHTDSGIDEPFLVRQLMDVIPNPWQCMRILSDTLATLRARKVSEEQLYVGRLDLLKEMKKDLQHQVAQASELLFKNKLSEGQIALTLVEPKESELNWTVQKDMDVRLQDGDQVLRRRNGEDIQKSLYERVYKRGLNNLEIPVAQHLDKSDSVHWWHRVDVSRKEYSLQGWQKQKVYPDLLVCLRNQKTGDLSFTLLETKGEHLKGNDDTEYKRKLFELFSQHASDSINSGKLSLGLASGLSFQMLLETDWEQGLLKQGI
ncbi:DEAD/DEAH box helicase [Vibrio sp. 1288]|uniref:DEAD/DEAH box helicase n=1 Tax=Vibrio sp. 1288 TaxID=3074550 RepID=UPI0029666773|nr:DEAD/DEAH box helicase family protein [Vibrio sp. 1288]MDW3137924.1 DEAD/DEAH box helicase family protein [Vibrio sp. 1288]